MRRRVADLDWLSQPGRWFEAGGADRFSRDTLRNSSPRRSSLRSEPPSAISRQELASASAGVQYTRCAKISR
jgi:hypothetical protein